MLERMTKFSLDRPKTVIGIVLIVTVLFGLQFPRISIDTDPENMLKPDQPDRVFYNRVKKDFGIHDLIVVGIVDKEGIFRPESLERVARVTSQILKIKGVIIEDVVSLTTTDNIKSSGGFLDIHPVMREISLSSKAVDQIRVDIAENPFLHEKIASVDGTAVALYIPIQKKDMSYRIAKLIRAILQRELLPEQTYHLAGLPVAEDTFGHEMFIQMAVVAPLAFMVILILVFLLFRKLAFLLPVGMDAMFAVIWAMGLLIGTGNTVHIMSSMIPVFLMPIAVMDDVHVLSEFFDRYRVLGDKRRALLEGMQPLYRPMLFTSLTSAAGFASLALADIPPVRVFGLFVAFGIMAAWLFSMTMVPAIISLMSEEKLKKILSEEEGRSSILDRVLKPIGRFAFSRARTVLIFALVLVAVGITGVMQIRINDNPVKWFQKGHPIRVADSVMNRLFGGTYMAYLVAEGKEPGSIKRPEVVDYIGRIQTSLEKSQLVGKTSSVADIVKRINLVLHDNDKAFDKVPDSSEAVGQFLFLFQSSGDPNDLDNFVDREARRANIWIQMKGGDNRQMSAVESDLENFIKTNPLPDGITLHWSGPTYINKVWQDLMVFGMLKAILGSFLVVFFLMMIGFRSLTLGLLSMVPLSVSILLSYGLIGWVGKDYDMPIAVCSSLSLGLGIDFAIHFIQRFQVHYAKSGNIDETNRYMFGEPGRAIARNAIVISLGFLPLVASSLTPYVTVGLFFALLMAFSTISTLFILPAALRIVGPRILNGGKS
ncbi:MAG: efflux RND transporter permease subunit [Candidatus Desulfatibia sp.]|uniref:efflux RND transporter permease subunit n=1 Tax=Candidatus Desulfatibia sp. TaxID=3101189 RepID=UPI002F335A5C